MVPEPTTTEWVMAAVAAVLIMLLGGLLFILPALRRGATPASRMAGFLLSCLATAMVVIAAVLVVAGIRARSIDPLEGGEGRPASPFARYLFDPNPASTERVATYGAAVLLPLAAVLGVLALAAVDLGRSIGLRAIAGLTCGALLIASVVLIIGDAGPLAARTAVGIGVLSAASAVALTADELRGPRRAAR